MPAASSWSRCLDRCRRPEDRRPPALSSQPQPCRACVRPAGKPSPCINRAAQSPRFASDVTGPCASPRIRSPPEPRLRIGCFQPSHEAPDRLGSCRPRRASCRGGPGLDRFSSDSVRCARSPTVCGAPNPRKAPFGGVGRHTHPLNAHPSGPSLMQHAPRKHDWRECGVRIGIEDRTYLEHASAVRIAPRNDLGARGCSSWPGCPRCGRKSCERACRSSSTTRRRVASGTLPCRQNLHGHGLREVNRLGRKPKARLKPLCT